MLTQNNILAPKLTIKKLIERSFIFSTLTILLITLIGAFYFNKQGLQERRDSNLQKTHEILSNLIAPVLTISDVTEIRRLLQLASSNESTFVVMDNNGGILMPDYAKIYLVKSLIGSNKMAIDCKNLRTVYKSINNNGYWINCSILKNEDLTGHDKNLGVLLSFSADKWLTLSPTMLIFVCVSILTLLYIVIWFRHILYKRLLRPLLLLGSQIVDKSQSPLTASSSIDDIGAAPYEIVEIKLAFEALLKNLQTEYHQRMENDKKAALFDLAAQVAHDIRSPLAVMEMTLHSTSKYILEENVNIQREAIQSVRNIANNLLDRYRKPNVDSARSSVINSDVDDGSIARPVFLSSLIEQVVSQKLFEWKNNSCEINVLINSDTKSICTYVAPNEIKRVISNLLNNAFESLFDKRKIILKLELSNEYLDLHISDSGTGIPADKINAVLTGSSLKHDGDGLGLSSAKRYLESLGGRLQLHSVLGAGTRVTLSFRISF